MVITAEELTTGMRQFTGTETYTRYHHNILLTDGVLWVAQEAGAFWLLDIIASYQRAMAFVPFQLWQLHNEDGKPTVVTMSEDIGAKNLVHQAIPYTDFPKGTWKFYLIDRVLMIPNEY